MRSETVKTISLVELIIRLRILHLRRPWPLLRLPWRPQLARIKAPRILNMLVEFVRMEDHPLLPSLLVKLSVRLPRPQ